jgi:lantibiotic modifying enzyme
MVGKTWCPVPFTESERDLICERIRDLGFRLQKSPKVLEMSQIAYAQSGYKKWASIYPQDNLAQGPLGLALMYNELHRVWPAEGWHFIAHKYLAEPLRTFSFKDDHALGLLSGACGLLFVTQQLALDGTEYTETVDQLKTLLSSAASRYASKLALDEYPHPENYDLVSGAVGIGTALLTQDADTDGVECEGLLALLSHLVWLGKQDMTHYMDQFASWYRSTDLHERQRRWQAHNSAYVGDGMRYGCAGLIALLSLALQKGLDTLIDGLPETVEYLCQRIVTHRGEQGEYWPQVAYVDRSHCPGNCAPFAWCNGATGITRALWLAGCALDNEELCSKALECLSEMGKRFRKEPYLIGPSLCHGLAGMVQVYAHFANETGESIFSDDVYFLTERLLDLFEVDRPFGYRAFGPEYIRFDSPWLFDGAAGVALALLTTISPLSPSWDRVMLLA